MIRQSLLVVPVTSVEVTLVEQQGEDGEMVRRAIALFHLADGGSLVVEGMGDTSLTITVPSAETVTGESNETIN